MTAKICKCFCKVYDSSSALNLPSLIFSRFTFLLENFNHFFKPLVLSSNPTSILDAFFTILSITKHTKEDLQRIFKMILEIQAPIPAPITFPEDFQERLFKTCFLNIYYKENHLDYYNFC